MCLRRNKIIIQRWQDELFLYPLWAHTWSKASFYKFLGRVKKEETPFRLVRVFTIGTFGKKVGKLGKWDACSVSEHSECKWPEKGLNTCFFRLLVRSSGESNLHNNFARMKNKSFCSIFAIAICAPIVKQASKHWSTSLSWRAWEKWAFIVVLHDTNCLPSSLSLQMGN